MYVAVASFRLTVVMACIIRGQLHHVVKKVFLCVCQDVFLIQTNIPFHSVIFGLKQPLN